MEVVTPRCLSDFISALLTLMPFGRIAIGTETVWPFGNPGQQRSFVQ